MKVYWHARLFPALRGEYEHRVDVVAARRRKPWTTSRQMVADSTLYRTSAGSSGTCSASSTPAATGSVPGTTQRRASASRRLAQTSRPAPLELDPELEMPRYYVNCDIHQHPGGVWSDPVAGFVYERGASTHHAARRRARTRDLHYRFTGMLEETCPAPQRVLDMGCGFGKSTAADRRAVSASARSMRVDLAAPVPATVAARDAAATCASARWTRPRTDYPDGAFRPGDLDDAAARDAAAGDREDARRSGARAAARRQDGAPRLPTTCAIRSRGFIHYTTAGATTSRSWSRSPRWTSPALLGELGFTNVEIEPFEEAEGALAPEFPRWRFPWTVITAERV